VEGVSWCGGAEVVQPSWGTRLPRQFLVWEKLRLVSASDSNQDALALNASSGKQNQEHVMVAMRMQWKAGLAALLAVVAIAAPDPVMAKPPDGSIAAARKQPLGTP
jgi:hypothetical protein